MIALAAALVLFQQASTPAEVRTLNVWVTDARGTAVRGLVPDEAAVLENGVARPVTRLEEDRRPLNVVVIVDSSAPMGTFYRLNLVDPFVQPTFDVQRGTLTFFGTPDLNPLLDIAAIHTVRQPRIQTANGRDVRVEVDITGTLARPQLALKNPDNLPLSESDLLSYLVTGEPAVGLDNTGTQVAARSAICWLLVSVPPEVV